MALRSEVQGITREALQQLPEDEKPKRVQQQDLKQINKKVIATAVRRQAKEAIRAESLLGRCSALVRSTVKKLRVRFGYAEPDPDFCTCSCPIGERYGEKDRHFTETFGGYTYRFCARCVEFVSFDEERSKPAPSDYYFCWTDATPELARNVVEAIRQGEVEAHLPRSYAREGEVRSEPDGGVIQVDGADDSAPQGEAPREFVRHSPAMGSRVATREDDRSLRPRAEFDSYVLDTANGGGEGLSHLGIDPAVGTDIGVEFLFCPACKTVIHSLEEAKEHTC